MARVDWTVRARRDLTEITASIRHFSESGAALLNVRITTAVDMLEDHPRIGRVVPEIGDENVRELIVLSYRVFSRLVGEDIQVLRVRHARMNLFPHGSNN